MVVQHNISAMTANRYYGINNKGLAGSLEKLASGYAINKAGDNAAGLAVSEKMRAQIGGLTQASKNAEDGISLVQTMEGALQETDSILQRMRTLAVQSANGSYQDDVDREAMQLEFDQLNDELNQIADTDFNGTVMLNGGQMADGTKADKDGKIKYVANAPRTESMQWGSKDINTVDSKGYNGKQAAANNLWNNLGLTAETRSVDVTFEYDKDADTWKAVDSNDGTARRNLANLTIMKSGATNTDITTPYAAAGNNGGFSVVSSGTQATGSTQVGATAPAAYAASAGFEYANVVLDSTKLVDGDRVTLTFTRPESDNTAPENVGIKDGSLDFDLANGTTATSITTPVLFVNGATASGAPGTGHYESTNDATADVPMTEKAAKSFNGLNDAEFTATYTNSSATASALSSIKIKLADGTEKEIGGATGSFETSDGISYTTTYSSGVLKINDDQGKELLSVTLAAAGAGTGMTTGEKSKVTFGIALDTAVYTGDAQEAKVSISEPEKSDEVSKSNAFNQSAATMTYTDSLSLQVGARTKDLVDFTFSYKSNGLGNLKANMNCSARSDGLGTADLSIKDQKSANDAIDKIDNAINKISMVRATFGAAQNRLEHKINNIDTNTENLTAAESRIRDTQMDKEMMKFTSAQILSQASQSMLAQANSLPQGVLQLLG